MKKKTARWTRAHVELIRADELSSNAVRTLLALRCYTKPEGDSCFPSTRTLCRDLHCSRGTLFRSLAELEIHQWIRRKQRHRKNGSLTTCLFILLDERKSLVREAFKTNHPSLKYGTRLETLHKPPAKPLNPKQKPPKIVPFTAFHG